MSNYYTENLAEFGYREIEELQKILTAWIENGLPDDFENSGTKPAFNKNSGFVFLVNDGYQVAMLNGDELETFHTLPYSGEEGFLAELFEENAPDALNKDDIEYLVHAAESAGLELQSNWVKYTTK